MNVYGSEYIRTYMYIGIVYNVDADCVVLYTTRWCASE